jgi:hypothetical protein
MSISGKMSLGTSAVRANFRIAAIVDGAASSVNYHP